MRKEERSILHTLRYFAQFQYAPTFAELHTFMDTEISSTLLMKLLTLLEKSQKIVKKEGYYTVGEYDQYIDMTVQKQKISNKKKNKIKRYIERLSRLKSILLVGFSGSIAMNNANIPDDIDLFIISEHKKMWITRLLSISLAELFSTRRKYAQTEAKDALCLNLFFDKNDLTVPNSKQNAYVAHEVLQLKPIINKKQTYEQFLDANKWVLKYFPNASKYYIQLDKKITKNIKYDNFTTSFLFNYLSASSE